MLLSNWSLTPNNQRVIELQESKRDLAGILLNTTSESDGQSNNKVRQLEVCIKLYLAASGLSNECMHILAKYSFNS